MLAPGPLLPAHIAVAGLEDNCFACHAPVQGTTAARCTTCHAVADIGLREVSGAILPQSLTMPAFHQSLARTECSGCHTDHPGPRLSPTHSHAFAHDMLAPAVAAECTGCHAAPKNRLHPDSGAACGSCHNQTDWSASTLDHTRLFALTGPHDAPCTTCHIGGNLKQYTCYGCHAHREATLISEHQEEGIRNIGKCVACHRDTDGEERAEDD